MSLRFFVLLSIYLVICFGLLVIHVEPAYKGPVIVVGLTVLTLLSAFLILEGDV